MLHRRVVRKKRKRRKERQGASGGKAKAQDEKAKDREERKTCTSAKTGRGGSPYRKWAPVLAFIGKRCMHLSTFLRGFLRAIVQDPSSRFAMEL